MPQKVRMSRLLPYVLNSRRLFVLGFGSMVAVTAGQLGGPLILKSIIDDSIPKSDLGGMALRAGAYFLLIVVMGILQWFSGITIGRLGLEVVTRIKRELFGHFLALPVSYFDVHPVGELMSRTESDTERVKEFFSRTAIALATDLLLFVGILAVCFTLDARITTWIAIIAPIVIAIVLVFFDRLRVYYERQRELWAAVLANVTEFLQGVEVLRAFGRIPWAIARLVTNSKAKRDNDSKSSMLEFGGMGALGFSMGPLFMAAAVAGLAPGILAGTFTMGTLLVFLEYGRRLFEPIMAIAENIRSIQQARASLARIDSILAIPGEPGGRGAEARFEAEIEFRNVWFAYKEEEWVLKDLSFSIPRGSTIALVGPSGSGKSTTVGLLTRFYRPQRGQILVDGISLEDIDLKAWRRLVGLVLQESWLFPGSILENVRLYDESIPPERVGTALAQVQALDFVGRQAGGMGAPIAEGGRNLSGGERQLLSFARAIVFEPSLVVLDEATASVDVRTERRIREGMSALLEGKTALIVAHRLSSVLDADTILFFREGEIVARGRHEELLSAFPEYAELVRLQFPDLEREAAR
ncbi:MAG TPA: ABC transporter ATP-binding protein [Rectinemataceae bacterium]|nr:ABC transporter ATP-binding protein [Rectinemataceae bacterium]